GDTDQEIGKGRDLLTKEVWLNGNLSSCAQICLSSIDSIRKKADSGNPIYSYLMGFHYLNGTSSAKDTVMAMTWYEKSIIDSKKQVALGNYKGFSMALLNLGVCHTDWELKLKYFKFAADAGEGDAFAHLGVEDIKNGDGEGALEKFKQAIRFGSSLGTVYLGAALISGRFINGVNQYLHYDEGYGNGTGFLLLARAALNDDPFAEYTFGSILFHGKCVNIGVSNNDAEALYWWKDAALSGSIEAALALGHEYHFPRLNFEKSFHWNLIAARAGSQFGQLRSGNHYKLGKGISVDINQAKFWFDKAGLTDMNEWYNRGGYFTSDQWPVSRYWFQAVDVTNYI
ncbi:MAG: sel1 repeat family protein, partial [Flavobacteriales bacterium]|nr:sel1 repeat family protein [Flavobacteriales bacterium]